MAKIQPDRISTTIDANTKPIQEKLHALTKETKELSNQNRDLRRKISELAAQEGDFSAEIARLNAQITENTRKMDDNKREIGKLESSLSLSGKTAAQLGRQLKDLKRELANCSRAAEPERYKELEKQIREVERAHAAATRSSQGFLSSLLSFDKWSTAIKGFFMGLAAVIGTQVIGAFKNLKNTIQEFTVSNSKLAAILGTTRDGISELTDQAKELGRTTSFTASQVTSLQTELAKLGFAMGTIKEMTPAVLKFSKAVDTDLGSAAAFAGATLRIFGKEATETEDVLATLAIATTKSALDFTKLEASMSTIGPVAAAFGLSLEDTTAMLGVLANAGFDASTAATATRNIILKLCDSSGELARALGEPAHNLDGIVAGLQTLEAEGVDLAQMLEITDKRSVAAFSSFLKQSDSLITLRNSITGVNGEFQQMAATMSDNAAAAEKGFFSAIEGLILRFGGLDSILQSLYKSGTVFVQFLGSLTELFTPLVTTLEVLGALIKEFYNFWARLFSKFTAYTPVAKTLNTVLQGLKVTISAIISGLTAYKIAMLAAAGAAKLKTIEIKKNVIALWSQVKATLAAKTAQDGLNKSSNKNIYAVLLSIIIALGVAIASYVKNLSEAKSRQKELMDSIAESAAQGCAKEKSALDKLYATATNSNKAYETRLKAVNDLRAQYPDYFSKLSTEEILVGKARNQYEELAKSIVKVAKARAAQDLIQSKQSEIIKLQMQMDEQQDESDRLAREVARSRSLDEAARKAAANRPRNVHQTVDITPYTVDRDAAIEAYRQSEDRRRKLKAQIADLTNDINYLEQAYGSAAAAAASLTNPSTPASLDAKDSTISRLKEIEAELTAIRKASPKTKEELDALLARKKQLLAEKKSLTGSSTHKKHETGTYSEDSIDQATAPIDDDHLKRLLKINLNEEGLSKTKQAIAKNRELIRYCSELLVALEKLRQKTKASHTQTLDRITAEQNKIAAQALKAQEDLNHALVQKDKEAFDSRSAAAEAYYEGLELTMRQSLEEEKITQGQFDILMLANQKDKLDEQLNRLKNYYRKVEKADYMSAEEKKTLLEQIEAQIRQTNSKILTATGQWAQKMREYSTNANSPEGLAKAHADKIRDTQATYDTLIEMARQAGDSTVALEAERRRRIANIDHEYLQQQFQLKELVGLTWADEYARELARLRNYHAQGLISETQFQQRRFQIGASYAQKYFAYYASISSSMFSAIQQSEIDASDAKFDILIRQAQNNGEQTADLEEQKENAKLEIQKRYADVNFAVKIGTIIADTAVAIMRAFADLGPIAGAIAAGILGTTSAAQIAIADAERRRIHALQPSHSASAASSSSSSTPTAQRVLSGFADGGFTPPGPRYQVAGVVHAGEYVVPQPIMHHPRVVDAVATIEAIRSSRIRSAGSPSTGYADGGFTAPASAPDTASLSSLSSLSSAITDLRHTAEALRRIRAYVVYRDISAAADTLARASDPFTRQS